MGSDNDYFRAHIVQLEAQVISSIDLTIFYKFLTSPSGPIDREAYTGFNWK
jgi:hypothetical protein